MSITTAKLKKPEVVDEYSQTAWTHDLWGALTETHARRRALELAQFRNAEAVLEFSLGYPSPEDPQTVRLAQKTPLFRDRLAREDLLLDERFDSSLSPQASEAIATP